MNEENSDIESEYNHKSPDKPANTSEKKVLFK